MSILIVKGDDLENAIAEHGNGILKIELLLNPKYPDTQALNKWLKKKLNPITVERAFIYFMLMPVI